MFYFCKVILTMISSMAHNIPGVQKFKEIEKKKLELHFSENLSNNCKYDLLPSPRRCGMGGYFETLNRFIIARPEYTFFELKNKKKTFLTFFFKNRSNHFKHDPPTFTSWGWGKGNFEILNRNPHFLWQIRILRKRVN